MQQAHDLGLNSMLIPESLGGLGLTPVDFVLLAEACGEVALPEPLVESVMVTTPSLVDILDQGLGNADVQKVIDGVLAGEVRVARVMPSTPASIMRTVRIGFYFPRVTASICCQRKRSRSRPKQALIRRDACFQPRLQPVTRVSLQTATPVRTFSAPC